MGFLDRAKQKAEELAKQAKPAAEQAKLKAKPMGEKVRDRSGKAAKALKETADGFREGLRGDEEPPSTAKPRPKPGPR